MQFEDGELDEANHHGEVEVKLNRLEMAVVRFGGWLSWLFLVAVVIAVYEVVSRHIFNAPTSWVHETTVFIVAGCLLYGGAYCLATRTHIRIGIIADVLPKKVQRILAYVNMVLITGFLTMLLMASYTMVNKALFSPSGAIHLETSGSAFNPAYPALLKVILLAVVALMLLQAFLKLFLAVRGGDDV